MMKGSESNNDAANDLANSVLPTPVGPRNKKLPIGLFGSLIPELAKSLAASLFDSEKHMIRIDMSEYMEKHAVSRMI
jgi:ATP-dependent Clp protease ATP-binding subunit ClpB